MTAPTDSELDIVIEAMPEHLRYPVITAAAAGLRWGEIQALTRDDFTVTRDERGEIDAVHINVDKAEVRLAGGTREGQTAQVTSRSAQRNCLRQRRTINRRPRKHARRPTAQRYLFRFPVPLAKGANTSRTPRPTLPRIAALLRHTVCTGRGYTRRDHGMARTLRRRQRDALPRSRRRTHERTRTTRRKELTRRTQTRLRTNAETGFLPPETELRHYCRRTLTDLRRPYRAYSRATASRRL